MRFFLSGRSAYVDGQVVTLSAADVPDRRGRRQAAGRQGRRRHRRGPRHRRRDREGAWPGTAPTSSPSTSRRPATSLAAVANEIGGTALQLDITAADAPQRLIEHLRERHGGVDIVVHNAGITRDKLLVNMDAARWNSVMAVNLQAQLDITAGAAGRRRRAARTDARIVCVSSQSGIAGNRGQTNYAASKAGVIGMVRAWAPAVRRARRDDQRRRAGLHRHRDDGEDAAAAPARSAPGINSLQQGGLPVDVAETIAWLSQPGSAGVNGQTVRVCGQSLLGA